MSVLHENEGPSYMRRKWSGALLHGIGRRKDLTRPTFVRRPRMIVIMMPSESLQPRMEPKIMAKISKHYGKNQQTKSANIKIRGFCYNLKMWSKHGKEGPGSWNVRPVRCLKFPGSQVHEYQSTSESAGTQTEWSSAWSNRPWRS
jgi:hypothetical protein